MSWTRLDDLWSERRELAGLDFADRWHYLCLIQFLSRTDQRDGHIRAVDARRASDHPNPAAALEHIAATGLIVVERDGYRLVEVDAHLPTDKSRKRTEQDRERKRRQRAHEAGDHSTCLPRYCDQAVTRDVTGDSHADFTGDVGTGRDGTGRAITEPSSENTNPAVVDWPVAEIPADPGYCSHGMTVGLRCSKCPEGAAQHRREAA